MKLANGVTAKALGKIRGTYNTKELAVARMAQIVRDIDSAYKAVVVNVGAWFPLIDNINEMSQDVLIVDDDADTIAQKMKLENNRKKTEEKYQDEKRNLEASQRLKNAVETDDHDDPESLNFFTMNMQTWRMLRENEIIEREKLKDIMKKKIRQREALEFLLEKHPEYSELWLDNMNERRRKAGIAPLVVLPDETEDFVVKPKKTRAPDNYTRFPVKGVIDPKEDPEDENNKIITYAETEHDYDSAESDDEAEREGKRKARLHLFERLRKPITKEMIIAAGKDPVMYPLDPELRAWDSSDDDSDRSEGSSDEEGSEGSLRKSSASLAPPPQAE
jgi:hypothetical protein